VEYGEGLLYDHLFCGVFGRPGQLGDSIDFEQIGIVSHDLSLLDQPVTDEEVWAAIKDIPSDRAPGPDGFTGAFYKSSWTVIRHDVMAAINALLFGDNRAFHRLNSALIVLLPKRADASAPADYRPITMIHSIAKLVSKILALRLAPRMDDLVSANQNAFIRGRSIHDNYKFVQRAAVLYRKRKIPRILLKLDISSGGARNYRVA
jgi:hypothetical protein